MKKQKHTMEDQSNVAAVAKTATPKISGKRKTPCRFVI